MEPDSLKSTTLKWPPGTARFFIVLSFLLLPFAHSASAQEKGSLDRPVLPPLENPEDVNLPAKELFGREISPSPGPPKSIGFYSKGCLAGAKELPITGPEWQVMRLSRNRNWGNPILINFIENFARQVPSATGWKGILIGDMAQPKGGPMITGHASHQIGLDVDIWLAPMPDHVLSREERETMSSTNLVRSDLLDIEPTKWTPAHIALLKLAAQQPDVVRIFVNPAIKKALCRDAGAHQNWLHKIRPFYGHNYHFHVRLACPMGDEQCSEQDPVPPGDGCDESLDYWFSDAILHPRPPSNEKPKPALTLSQLPPQCRDLIRNEQ